MAGIVPDITRAFGDTPLVRLNALAEGVQAEVVAKLEFYNPGASVKDRLGYALIEAAADAAFILGAAAKHPPSFAGLLCAPPHRA